MGDYTTPNGKCPNCGAAGLHGCTGPKSWAGDPQYIPAQCIPDVHQRCDCHECTQFRKSQAAGRLGGIY